MTDSKVIVFDTTLRDGEQSPGCSMNLAEKLRMARQLERLGVDVIEAGFPIASDGDFEAVQSIAREIRRPTIAALARATREDILRAWGAVSECMPPAHPHLPGDFRHSPRVQTPNHPRRGDQPSARGGGTRALAVRGRRVLAGRRDAHRSWLSFARSSKRRSTRALPRSTSPIPSATPRRASSHE